MPAYSICWLYMDIPQTIPLTCLHLWVSGCCWCWCCCFCHIHDGLIHYCFLPGVNSSPLPSRVHIRPQITLYNSSSWFCTGLPHLHTNLSFSALPSGSAVCLRCEPDRVAPLSSCALLYFSLLLTFFTRTTSFFIGLQSGYACCSIGQA